MKILVVDDSNTMRRIITNTLNRVGYSDVVEAENGKIALDKFNSLPIELILTDWNMPVMSGLNFIAAVRESHADIPILMITTNAAKEDIVTALQAGATNYIVKPFTPETLKVKMDDILS